MKDTIILLRRLNKNTPMMLDTWLIEHLARNTCTGHQETHTGMLSAPLHEIALNWKILKLPFNYREETQHLPSMPCCFIKKLHDINAMQRAQREETFKSQSWLALGRRTAGKNNRRRSSGDVGNFLFLNLSSGYISVNTSQPNMVAHFCDLST